MENIKKKKQKRISNNNNNNNNKSTINIITTATITSRDVLVPPLVTIKRCNFQYMWTIKEREEEGKQPNIKETTFMYICTYLYTCIIHIIVHNCLVH